MTTQIFQKPTIFISSTIYDFRDLRSSLKYYLEELGYIVNMSEFNDFRRMPDENSYMACLNTVKTSDYFILLIGSRVGGMYDKANGITITQEEYRTAYAQAKEGKTRILVFVRSDVWTVREDRNALAELLQYEYINSGEMGTDSAERLSNHASKFVTDAKRIFAFINEVCRIDEMKSAVAGKGLLPPANWVHRFETFRDIVDALRVQFDVVGDLKTKILVDNIKVELLNNLAAMSTKASGDIYPVTYFTEPFRKRYSLKFGEKVTVERSHVLWVVLGSLLLLRPQKSLRWRALDQCIDNGIFMEFDVSSGTIKRTVVQDALERLRVSIEQYMACDLSDKNPKMLTKYGKVAEKEGETEVESNDFAEIITAANRLDDIIWLTKAIYFYIDGETVDFDKQPRQPRSPFSDEDEKLAKQDVSVDEIASWLTSARNQSIR